MTDEERERKVERWSKEEGKLLGGEGEGETDTFSILSFYPSIRCMLSYLTASSSHKRSPFLLGLLTGLVLSLSSLSTAFFIADRREKQRRRKRLASLGFDDDLDDDEDEDDYEYQEFLMDQEQEFDDNTDADAETNVTGTQEGEGEAARVRTRRLRLGLKERNRRRRREKNSIQIRSGQIVRGVEGLIGECIEER